MKKLGFFIAKSLGLLSFYSLKKSGYLHDKGWFQSFKLKRCVDKNGQPIPWMTYSFLDFVEPRLKKEMTVFEYGCGNSTRWWAKKILKVTSSEHDRNWMQEIKAKLPDNAEIVHFEKENFASSIQQTDELYDIIVIDGEDRVNCAKYCLNSLKPKGIIIWDNSDRKEYQEGYDFIEQHGFKRLDFYGLGPINVMSWSTSVYYRAENCLDI